MVGFRRTWLPDLRGSGERTKGDAALDTAFCDSDDFDFFAEGLESGDTDSLKCEELDSDYITRLLRSNSLPGAPFSLDIGAPRRMGGLKKKAEYGTKPMNVL
jgi:hypothetical protein